MTAHGTTAPGYESVRDTFQAVLDADAEHAAQVSVYLHGQPVVDLWGGPDMAEDSILGIYSATKGATAVAAALLVEQGLLDLDREVRYYWPEFAAEGKDFATVRQLLCHQVGSVGTEQGFSAQERYDDRAVAEQLAPHAPYWRPGTTHGYHAITFGALVGELARRTTGRDFHEFYDAEIRDARGVDFFIGLPEKHEPRVLDCQEMVMNPMQKAMMKAKTAASDSIPGIALNDHRHPAPIEELPNSRHVRESGSASVGGVASARGLARLYASAISTVDGMPPLLSRTTATVFAQPHSVGHDLVLRRRCSFGLGFQIVGELLPFLGAGAFGHDGFGGALGFADPRSGLAFGYVRRRAPFPGSFGNDATRLAQAARACALG